MDRYCLYVNCNQEDFQKEDMDSCLDINFKKLVNELILQWEETSNEEQKKEFIKNVGLHGDFELWRSLKDSYEFKLDILKEIYLQVCFVERKKERLFLDDEETDEKMRNTIKNIKKESSNLIKIFDTSEITSIGKSQKINCFGSGVCRLWFSSREFRNIFAPAYEDTKKYNLEKILEWLWNSWQHGINYKEDDAIILEKILGISTRYYIHIYIWSILEEWDLNDSECLKKFVEKIMQYKGEHSRCAVIQILGFELQKIKGSARKIDIEQTMERFYKIVDGHSLEFNRLYDAVVEVMMTKYRKIFCLETAKEIVFEKIKETFQISHPVKYDATIYDEITRLQMELWHKREGDIKGNDIRQLEKLSLWMPSSHKVECFCIEALIQGRKYPSVENMESNKLLNEIQKIILEKNMLRYEIK